MVKSKNPGRASKDKGVFLLDDNSSSCISLPDFFAFHFLPAVQPNYQLNFFT
jgi:hypothetical protein